MMIYVDNQGNTIERTGEIYTLLDEINRLSCHSYQRRAYSVVSAKYVS